MVDQGGPTHGNADADPLQDAVTGVLQRFSGNDDPETVRQALREAIGAAGIPEQPQKWVEDTASEIAAGRSVYVHGIADAEPRSGDEPPHDPSAT